MSSTAIVLRIIGALGSSEGENGKAALVAIFIAGFTALIFFAVGPVMIVVMAVSGWQYDASNYTQISSSDYLDGQTGTNYGDIILDDWVYYYNQTDSRWGSLNYGKTSTIASAGCGPTAMSIVISSFLDEEHNPLELAQWAYSNGYYCEGNGSYHTLIPAAGAKYGLTTTLLGSDGEAVMTLLENGGLVVAIMSAGHFTSGGHFIVLRGVTEDGNILVADPNNYSRTLLEWDPDIIWDEASTTAGAGGPFWGFTY